MADYGKLLVNVTTDTGQFPIQNARVTIYVIETTIPVNRQLLEGEQRVDEQSPGQQLSEGVSEANPEDSIIPDVESRMEGSVNGSVYSTMVRCAMPGNPSASQLLYEVQVDMTNGNVTQTRVLTDNQVTTFNLW